MSRQSTGRFSVSLTAGRAAGVSERTVRRYLEKCPGRQKGQWNKRALIDENAVVSSIEAGRLVCKNQPCRYAPPIQLNLFDAT